MKRPMIFAGVAALLFSLAFYYAPQITPYLFILFLALCVVVFISQRKHLLSFLPILLIVIMVFLRGNYAIYRVAAFQSFQKEIFVSGIVTEVSPQDDSVFYTVKSKNINGKEIKANVSLLSYDELYARVGDRIEFSAVVHTDNVSAYGNEVDLRNPTVISLKSDKNVYSFFDDIRNKIRNFIFDNIPYDNATLLLGVLLGDKAVIGEELSENIKNSGVSHIVVTSGMHLAIITRVFFGAAFGKKNKFLYSVLGIIFVSSVVMLTGASISVLRAALMYYIIFFGLLISRRADALSSLFASAVLLVFINPFVAGNFSFQLSAAATFGVIAVAPVLQNIVKREEARISRIMHTLAGIVATSFSATLLTAPFLILKFSAFSVVGIFVNLLITHLTSVLLTVSLLSVASAFIPFVRHTMCAVASLCSGIVTNVINAFGSLPFAYIEIENPVPFAILSALLAVAVSVYCIYKYDEIRIGDKDAFIV